MSEQPHASDEAVRALENKVAFLRYEWRKSIKEGKLPPEDEHFFRVRTWSLVAEALDMHFDFMQVGHGYCSELALCACHFSEVVTEVERYKHKGRLFTFEDKLSEWVTTTLWKRIVQPLLAKFHDDSVADKIHLFKEVEVSSEHIKASMEFAEILFDDGISFTCPRKVFQKACRTVVHGSLNSCLVAGLIQEVNAQREGTKLEDLAALQACWRTYVEVGRPSNPTALFVQNVKAPYEASLRESYRKVALSADRVDYSKYLAWADERVNFELSLMTHVFFVHNSQVLHAVAAALVTPYRFEIINHPECGFAALLNAWDEAALARMYSLMQRVYDREAIHQMCDALYHHLLFKALPSLLGTQVTGWALLLSVHAAHNKYNTLIRDSLDNHAWFRKALKHALGTHLKTVGAQCTLFAQWNHARATATSAVAEVLKVVAELLLVSETFTMTFEAQFREAFAAFYRENGVLPQDQHRLASQFDFELMALPSSDSALHMALSSGVAWHFAPAVRGVAIANATSLLQAWDQAELACLYALAKRVKDPHQAAVRAMGKALRAHIVEEGKQLLHDFEFVTTEGPLSHEKPVVPPIVELNHKYSKLIADCFENNEMLLDYRKLGFAAVLQAPLQNKDPKASCKRLAPHHDQSALAVVANAARCVSSPSAASALKAAAELFIDVVDSKAFEEQYFAAFIAFYVYAARAMDSQWLERQFDFELAALPSKASSLYRKVMAHFVTAVTNLVATTASPLLRSSPPPQAELSQLYTLAKRVQSDLPMRAMGKALQGRVGEEGAQVLRDFEGATSDGPLSLEKPLVTSVVELNKKYSKLIAECFENDAKLLEYRKRGFTEVLKAALKRKDPKPSAGEGAVEEKETSFSEALATFLDAVMKRELKDVVEHEAEFERLDDLLTLFTYITEKDVFQEFYKAKLAKRLLQTTPNEDLEKGFLERLQREMGKSFTRAMESMLLDCDSTRALSEKFAQDSSSAGLGVELEVRVLTAVNWPAYKSDSLQPPLSLKRCVEAFTRFYKKSHQTRQLTWINMLGSATLNLLFPKGTKDVTATLHQASVLVLVDEAGQLSVRALAEALGLELKGLKPHIASMYLSKFQLLQLTNEAGEKQATATTIGDDDYFAMNPEFKHSTRKFRLPSPLAKADGDVKAPPIDDRRKIHIEAAVVRIMKSRKTLSYAELQDMTINMLSKYFIAQPKMVKARVEDLIDREYLKRRLDDPKVLDYLA